MLYWKNSTIARMLRQSATQWGTNEALVWAEGRLSYAEIYDRACRLAWGLHKAGIERGEHVATIFGVGPDWIIAKYALHILGAVIVPVNVNFRSRELAFVLKQADVKTLITVDRLPAGDYLEIIKEVDAHITGGNSPEIRSDALPDLKRIICLASGRKKWAFAYDFDHIMASGAGYDQTQIDSFIDAGRPNDRCNIIFTSGSTAFPKGAVHIHTSIMGIGYHLLARTFNLNEDHKILNAAPFFHVGGCVYMPMAALLTGCSMYVSEFVPVEILKAIQREKIHWLGGIDAHFNGLSHHPDFHSYDLGSIKFVFLAVGPEWYDRIPNIFPGVKIIAHHYSFTEGGAVSMRPDESDYEIRKYTNGRPWPGIEIKVVDPDTGCEVSPGTPGELCLRGWSRFQEYYNNPEETAKAIDADGFFHSGDYGWMDEAGNVTYRGRYKMMIKTGGENVSQREVEVFLEGLAGIRAVQVIGLPHEKWGEAVTAVIETEPGVDLTQADVIDYCKNKIANFKIPKTVLFINGEKWPLVGPAKVDKKRLKEWALEQGVA